MDSYRSTIFLILIFIDFSHGFGEENVTAELGQNVTLHCQAPKNIPVTVAEWSRTDSKEKYLLLYRDNQIDLDNQEPSFRNRVHLLDREIKNGDLSLILQNVMTGDRGRYECRVIQREPNRRKRTVINTEPISIINLDVLPPDPKDDQREYNGSYRGHGALVGVVVIIAVVAVVLV